MPGWRTVALAGAGALAGAAALAVLVRGRRLRVAKLVVYPIKGCKGIALRSARIQAEGLEHDREYAIVRPRDGSEGGWQFVSQREVPAEALVEPSMPDSDGQLVVRAPAMKELAVPPPGDDARRISFDVWGDAAEGLDCGDAAAAWFSEFLKVPGLRLLRHVGVRRIDETFAKGVSRFSDGFPLLVTTEASLASIERATGLGLPVLRFRPNLVLAGASNFEEDTVLGVACGSGASAVKLHFVKPCARCQVPSVDPVWGVRGKDPLRAMKSFRSGRALKDMKTAFTGHFEKNLGETFFGQNAVPDFSQGRDGSLTVGDIAQWI